MLIMWRKHQLLYPGFPKNDIYELSYIKFMADSFRNLGYPAYLVQK